jgi:hypothetical protein
MERKNMIEILNEFDKDSDEIIKQNSYSNLYLMLNKQYDLMLNIIQTRNLYKYGIDNLFKNMILSIFDELNEYIDVIFAYELSEEKRKIEALFELVDALHFIFQLHFLGTIKKKNYSILDLFNKEEIRNEIINYAYNDFKTLTCDSTLVSINLNSEVIRDLYIEMMQITSEILQYIHWKHWKTYTNFEYDLFREQLVLLYKKVLFNFKLVSQDEKNYEYLIVKYYVTKNIENFDRQIRGY